MRRVKTISYFICNTLLLLALAGCGAPVQRSAEPTRLLEPTLVLPSSTPAPPTPSPTFTQPSKAALVERALASVGALQASGEFAFESQITAMTKLKLTSGDQTLQDSTLLLSYVDEGSWMVEEGKTNIGWRRIVYFPGSRVDYDMNSEMRLVDGQIFLRAAYNQPKPDLPVMPDRWVRVNGASTLLYWPGINDLSLEASLAEMQADAWAMLSGHSLETLRKVLLGSQESAERATSTQTDGAPAEMLTFAIHSTMLNDTLRFPPQDNPANQKLLAAIQGKLGNMKFTLDRSGRLIAWEQAFRIDIQGIDFSGIQGAPQGSRMDIQAEENTRVTILPTPALTPVAAPTPSEMAALPAYSGDLAEVLFPTLADFDAVLNEALSAGKLDDFWEELSAAKHMPLVFGDLAVFLYRGPEKNVAWQADWSYQRDTGTSRLKGSDLWMHTVRLPVDARLEYQIQLDGEKGIVDPLNTNVEVGGLGSKSVAQMPGYELPGFTEVQPDVAQGSLTENITLHSQSLGYDVIYRVYTPAGAENVNKLPVLYVTDGQDFLEFGKMAVVLDNLIAEHRIQPVLAVFIDPREPKTGENLREKQFLDNPKFAEFIASELVPVIDRTCPTDPSPDRRGILGASYGGYFTVAFALEHSDKFHLVASFSPSFWHNPDIIETYRKADRLPLKFFISTGVFNDNNYHSNLFKEMLAAKGYELVYLESNEGHSYGNWRAKLNQALEFLYPAL